MALFIFNQKYILVCISEAHHFNDIKVLSGFVEVLTILYQGSDMNSLLELLLVYNRSVACTVIRFAV